MKLMDKLTHQIPSDLMGLLWLHLARLKETGFWSLRPYPVKCYYASNCLLILVIIVLHRRFYISSHSESQA